jgi:glycine/D-amino acid oxidase-like deaminating enzyme
VDETLTERASDDGSRPASAEVDRYRRASFWFDSLWREGADDLLPRPALGADLDVDVCIVGGGLTGLWTAYYLAVADPSLSIAVIEKEIAGFGASGRNGGWCSALFPQSAGALESRYGFEAARAMRRAMVDTVGEVERAADEEGIDCDFERGGTVVFARSGLQVASAREDVREARRFGDETDLWGTSTTRERFGVRDALATVFTPDCARVQPAKLVRGVARAVERRGVKVFEQTEALDWGDHVVNVRSRPDGASHRISAGTIVSALEGYGSLLPQVGRRILPLYSLMIATEPLPDEVWDRIGIQHGQTFSDYRHLLIYGQRTADNRFAFGGRGARYHLGSAIHPGYDTVERVRHHLRNALVDLFPEARGAHVTHHWGGPLGVPRDWHASVGYDPVTGNAWAGGYVGDGLSTTNIAGRTLADLITGRSTPLTSLPWVGHRSPRWEREPLRFLGANAGLVGMQLADAEEQWTHRPSVVAKLMAPLTGH